MTDPAPRPGRGRRPAAEVRTAALAAAAEVLLSEGIRAVTFERVATTGGLSRTTLHKWWPTPGALAVEAYFARAEPLLDFPDTADVEADLTTQLTAFVVLLTGPTGPVVAGLLGAAQSDPALAAAWSEHYSRPRRDLAVRALRRARSRGQVAEDVDLAVVVDQLWGACYHRLLIPDEPLTPDLARHLVRNVLHGIAPRSGPGAGVRDGLTGLVTAARGRFGRR
ncbi:TetR family transcriptional regulator [Serinibacter arcticus]|uniref:TetR family transcriptional regulator n=1 Tax=Serinibacter arcticus TaxID=1655435 RepID=A0A2U1ZWJ6_9MICO|nr:TetR-like C-terminal domain-containing protein [Serinibacter arcticus]PWD51359.1 TetR family transcriptional regulator [Serinibacter arcticus]